MLLEKNLLGTDQIGPEVEGINLVSGCIIRGRKRKMIKEK